ANARRSWLRHPGAGVPGDSGGPVRHPVRPPGRAPAGPCTGRADTPVARGGCGRSGAVSRPSVSVVMPFAGDAHAAREALATLSSLHTQLGDELILAANSERGVGSTVDPAAPIRVAERSWAR